MEKSKKSGFARLICSLLPGAGEMYMGFMKSGASLMILFFITCSLASLLGDELWRGITIVVWCYSFFHVHNLASLSDEKLRNMPDEFIVNEKSKGYELFKAKPVLYKVAAVVLILIGALMCIKGVYRFAEGYIPEAYINVIDNIVDVIPRIVIGAIIIAFGVFMINGKKKEMIGSTENFTSPDSVLKNVASKTSEAKMYEAGTAEAGIQYSAKGNSDTNMQEADMAEAGMQYSAKGNSDAKIYEAGTAEAGIQYSAKGNSDANMYEAGTAEAGIQYSAKGNSDTNMQEADMAEAGITDGGRQ